MCVSSIGYNTRRRVERLALGGGIDWIKICLGVTL